MYNFKYEVEFFLIDDLESESGDVYTTYIGFNHEPERNEIAVNALEGLSRDIDIEQYIYIECLLIKRIEEIPEHIGTE